MLKIIPQTSPAIAPLVPHLLTSCAVSADAVFGRLHSNKHRATADTAELIQAEPSIPGPATSPSLRALGHFYRAFGGTFMYVGGLRVDDGRGRPWPQTAECLGEKEEIVCGRLEQM